MIALGAVAAAVEADISPEYIRQALVEQDALEEDTPCAVRIRDDKSRIRALPPVSLTRVIAHKQLVSKEIRQYPVVVYGVP